MYTVSKHVFPFCLIYPLFSFYWFHFLVSKQVSPKKIVIDLIVKTFRWKSLSFVRWTILLSQSIFFWNHLTNGVFRFLNSWGFYPIAKILALECICVVLNVNAQCTETFIPENCCYDLMLMRPKSLSNFVNLVFRLYWLFACFCFLSHRRVRNRSIT